MTTNEARAVEQALNSKIVEWRVERGRLNGYDKDGRLVFWTAEHGYLEGARFSASLLQVGTR